MSISVLNTSVDEDFQAIVAMFVDELADRIASIQQAVDDEDVESLRRVSHQLKGAAGGYGYADLGTLAAVVEQQCREDADEISRLAAVDRLIAACQQAIDE